LALAQALNCTPPDPPCGQCTSCLKITKQSHPDVQLVVGEGAGESIKIDQVRALQREAALSPYEGRYRVFVLRQFDRASVEAANSLLKTLEEPPAHVVLGLTATHAEALPSTVVSRCQRLDLRPAASHIIETALQEKKISTEKAQLLARLSGGRVGWAFNACVNDDPLHQREQDLDLLAELLAADRAKRFDFAKKASRDGGGCRRQIALWIGWWRDLLLLCSQNDKGVMNVDRLGELRSLVQKTNESQIWSILSALQTTAAQLEANVNAQLALESLMLKLPEWQQASGPLSVEY